MTKRAHKKFEPLKPHRLDFFPTPETAMASLMPYLLRDDVRTFAEPCDGEGDLRRHLEARGLVCNYFGDIHTGQDALLRSDFGDVNAAVTNPPHRKDLLIPLIRHLQSVIQTWLLLTSDFLMNECAGPLIEHCSDIVTIGRLKWVKGTESSGFDNFVWARFDIHHHDGPHFYNDRNAVERRARDAAARGVRKRISIPLSTGAKLEPRP